MRVTYRDILKSLPLDEKKQLISLTNRHGTVQLGGHLGLIGLMAAGQFAFDGVLGALALMGQGIAMCFLFCAMHEASHGTDKRLEPACRSRGRVLALYGPAVVFLFS